MALGRYALTDVQNGIERLDMLYQNMSAEHVTFNNVVRGLENWKDQTVIGSESLERLKRHLEDLKRMLDDTKKYNEILDELYQKQVRINAGGR